MQMCMGGKVDGKVGTKGAGERVHMLLRTRPTRAGETKLGVMH